MSTSGLVRLAMIRIEIGPRRRRIDSDPRNFEANAAKPVGGKDVTEVVAYRNNPSGSSAPPAPEAHWEDICGLGPNAIR
jgi:hypothetical protein